MRKAEIAKKLVDNDPSLLGTDKKSDLIENMDTLYIERHAVSITLDENDAELLRLLCTHEDDMPSAWSVGTHQLDNIARKSLD